MGEAFGSWLREKRKHASLTLADAAQRAGVSEGFVSKIEKGTKRPSVDVLVRLAQAYGVRPVDALRRGDLLTDEAVIDLARRPTYADVVTGDPDLSREQKRQLIDLYSLFVRGGRARTAR